MASESSSDSLRGSRIASSYKLKLLSVCTTLVGDRERTVHQTWAPTSGDLHMLLYLLKRQTVC